MRGVRHTTNGIEIVEVPRPTGDGVRVKIKAQDAKPLRVEPESLLIPIT